MILPRGFFLHLIDASSHVHAPFIGKKQCQIFSRAKFPIGVEPQGRSVRFLNEVERRRLSRRFTWWERFIAEFRDIFGYSIIALLLSLRIFFVRSSLNLCTRIAANILCFIIFVITFSVKYKYERKGFNLLLFLIDRFFIFFFFFIRDKAHSPCLRFGWFGFDDRGRAKMNLILNCWEIRSIVARSILIILFVKLAKKQIDFSRTAKIEFPHRSMKFDWMGSFLCVCVNLTKKDPVKEGPDKSRIHLCKCFINYHAHTKIQKLMLIIVG